MHGENNLAAEMCTLFSVAAQIPLKYVVGRSYTSEFALIKKLFRYLKKGDLLLLDNGFYSFNVFQSLNSRCCHFIIPASIALRPKVLQRLGTDDFLAEMCSRFFGGYPARTVISTRKAQIQKQGQRDRQEKKAADKTCKAHR
jgi:hypothetical protein